MQFYVALIKNVSYQRSWQTFTYECSAYGIFTYGDWRFIWFEGNLTR